MIIAIVVGVAWCVGLASAVALAGVWGLRTRFSRSLSAAIVALICFAYYPLLILAVNVGIVRGLAWKMWFMSIVPAIRLGVMYGRSESLPGLAMLATTATILGGIGYLYLTGSAAHLEEAVDDPKLLTLHAGTRRHRIFLVLAILGLAAPALALLCPWSSQGTLVRDKGFQGVIMDKNCFAKGVTLWPAAKSDIMVLEADLREYVNSDTQRFGRVASELPLYNRQYLALVRNGKRTIFAQLDHRGQYFGRFECFHWTPIISGGGYHHWRIEYYPDTRSDRKSVV